MMKVRALQLLVPSDVVNGNKGVSLLPRSGLLEQVFTADPPRRFALGRAAETSVMQ